MAQTIKDEPPAYSSLALNIKTINTSKENNVTSATSRLQSPLPPPYILTNVV